ncbi:MAG: hypothetical protein HY717_08855 [Planctomycetes bacterium]|nr:hypothetical protein [Planctomycetota bacterium]
MNDQAVIDLFVEDRAHEKFLSAMLRRLAREEEKRIEVHVRASRGGHGRAIKELNLYMKSVNRRVLALPDLVFVVIDANCTTYRSKNRDIGRVIKDPLKDRAVITCPDPHIERWYLVDPPSFNEIVGYQPKLGRRKCTRDLYKARLADAVARGGHPPTLGGIEFAEDLVEKMDLLRAGKSEPSLRDFLEDSRRLIKSI